MLQTGLSAIYRVGSSNVHFWPETRLLITSILAELQKLGRTAIVATHETSRLRDEFDYIAHLHEGRMMTLHHASDYPHFVVAESYE
jgi:ABC-type multidrug transport system ATPase subunit